MLPLFYQEPDPDRWIPGDRYPRKFIRHLVRGRRQPGGQEIVFLNLKTGLQRLQVDFSVNDFSWARRHSSAPVGIIGKTHLVEERPWSNPIMLGASIVSHPLAAPDLTQRHPIKRVLVPGDWMRDMFIEHWGDIVHTWPVGIDTERWSPPAAGEPDVDVLIYDKVRWEHERYDREFLQPIQEELNRLGLTSTTLRYGYYQENEFEQLLNRSRSLLFLCEHETQGLAYQQCLAKGVPILAWDRGGSWQDPEYYPERVDFGPVSSVPYWDERCGMKFSGIESFSTQWKHFWECVNAASFSPRDYILENLTLEKAALSYLAHWDATFGTKLSPQGRVT